MIIDDKQGNTSRVFVPFSRKFPSYTIKDEYIAIFVFYNFHLNHHVRAKNAYEKDIQPTHKLTHMDHCGRLVKIIHNKMAPDIISTNQLLVVNVVLFLGK